jgi:hypothetical protein
MDDLQMLLDWKNAGDGTKPYSLGQIVNETEALRIVGDNSTQSQGSLKCTKWQIQQMMLLYRVFGGGVCISRLTE